MSGRTDFDKIIIVAPFGLDQQEDLDAIALHMDGLKVDGMLCICDKGAEVDEDDLLDELYDDCYDQDDIDVTIYEAFNGLDAIVKISDFIEDNWDEDTMVLFYNSDKESFEKLHDLLLDIDGNIYLSDYHEIFKDGKATEKSIKEIMESVGIRSNLILEDSKVSEAFFLGALVDRLNNR